jgi:hypothetical protein
MISIQPIKWALNTESMFTFFLFRYVFLINIYQTCFLSCFFSMSVWKSLISRFQCMQWQQGIKRCKNLVFKGRDMLTEKISRVKNTKLFFDNFWNFFY